MPAQTTSASTVACWVGPNPWASRPRQRTPPPVQPSVLLPFAENQTSCGSPGAVVTTSDHTGAVGLSADTRAGTASTASAATTATISVSTAGVARYSSSSIPKRTLDRL